jgi:hypothetical protein
MISALKVGVRVMLNNDRLGNNQVLDSSPIKRTASKYLQWGLRLSAYAMTFAFPGW